MGALSTITMPRVSLGSVGELHSSYLTHEMTVWGTAEGSASQEE